MVAVNSTMLELGTSAPNFDLPKAGGGRVKLTDSKGAKGTLVMFICNHCPFVKHVRNELIKLGNDYQKKGVSIIGINSNDWKNYPDDTPEKMTQEGYSFPYLYDETQEVAKKYKAACTPDFYLFDSNLKLVYRGQLDDGRPSNNIPVTGKDLRRAIDTLLAGKSVSDDQKPSIGCNIKWRPGNEPNYFTQR